MNVRTPKVSRENANILRLLLITREMNGARMQFYQDPHRQVKSNTRTYILPLSSFFLFYSAMERTSPCETELPPRRNRFVNLSHRDLFGSTGETGSIHAIYAPLTKIVLRPTTSRSFYDILIQYSSISSQTSSKVGLKSTRDLPLV